MSDSVQAPREWSFYVKDMIEFCGKVQNYTANLHHEGFVADERTYDATVRNLELIGEAATHIPSRVRKKYPEIPWRALIGLRNRLIHVYLGIDDIILWTVIQEAVPTLPAMLRDLLEAEGSGA